MKNLTLIIFFLFFNSVCAEEIIKKNDLEKSYKAAEDWFLKSFNEKGLFNYLYDPQKDEYSTSNNAIRQLMASRLLAELAHDNPKLLELHQKNLDYIFKYWVIEKENLKLVYVYKKSKLGANAMLLRTLVASPLYEKYKKETEQVKNAVLRGVNKNGSMNPFLVEPDYQYDWHYLLTFYSGEALVALIEYYQKTKDPGILGIIRKSQNFYIDRYVKNLSRNYYPAYVPWHTIALNKLYKMTRDKKYAEAIFTLNDKLLEIQDRVNHVGRFYNPATPQYGNPHASSDGVYTEGLAYAYEVAKLLKDELRMKAYREATEIGFQHLISLQYKKNNSADLPKPQNAIGAFRIRRTSPDAPFSERTGSNIRIDSVQHTLDAYRKYLSL